MEDFSQLYKTHSKDIYKYLFYLTGDQYRAEELLQETFFQAFRSLNKFEGKSKFSTWLYAIAKNIYITQLRKDKKHNYIPLEEELGGGGEEDNPERIFEERQDEKRILDSIQGLDQSYRSVVVLRIFNDLSFKEIGYILDKNETWARVSFYRAKLKLQQTLNKEGN